MHNVQLYYLTTLLNVSVQFTVLFFKLAQLADLVHIASIHLIYPAFSLLRSDPTPFSIEVLTFHITHYLLSLDSVQHVIQQLFHQNCSYGRRPIVLS